MIERRCSVCGRVLKKSFGIGPVCLRNSLPKTNKKASKIVLAKYMDKHDIFLEENNGSSENETTNSSPA